jgi:membrane associated rhomboid family serine protease
MSPPTREQEPSEERRKFLHSLVFPTFFLLLIWVVRIVEVTLDLDLSVYGIYPLKLRGLPGIITGPLIHADIKHLFDNSVPLFFLSLAIFYFYREVAYRVFFLTLLLTGIWVWFGGRMAYHIGSSGLVYGFASFLFFSGIIRNNLNMLAISLLVVFLYGGLVWGLFPYDYRVSWESHMGGVVSGLVMAFYYRKYGPPSTKYTWEDEEEDEEEDEDVQ